jgi:hypothetical protein
MRRNEHVHQIVPRERLLRVPVRGWVGAVVSVFGEADARGPVSEIVGYSGDEKDYRDVGGLCGFVVDDTLLGLVLDN